MIARCYAALHSKTILSLEGAPDAKLRQLDPIANGLVLTVKMGKPQAASQRRGSRGSSALEMAFLMPWYIFLFVGVFDWGYYAHALISVESAVRSAVQYTSQSSKTATDQTTACIYALNEMKVSQNVPANSSCNADPLVVTASLVASGADGNAAASITVKYHTAQLIPIPLILNNQFWIVQTLQMRLQS